MSYGYLPSFSSKLTHRDLDSQPDLSSATEGSKSTGTQYQALDKARRVELVPAKSLRIVFDYLNYLIRIFDLSTQYDNYIGARHV